MNQIFGQKVGMTRLFTEDGESVPVTVLELGPNVVYQVKSKDTDGYKAVQVGFGTQKAQRLNRAMTGHVSKAKKGSPRMLAEIRLDTPERELDDEYSVGDEIRLEGMFEVGAKVDVVGDSIGKGFAGVMKRHGMHGAQTLTHGTHETKRHAGSIGNRKFPGRVWKNKRMAGHMGAERVMQEGLEVVDVRPDENLLFVKGSVPGHKDAYVYVRKSVKR